MRFNKDALLLLVLFVLWIVIVPIICIVTPNREYSELEKRSLALMPEFDFDKLLDGSFTNKIEDCISDQFPYRDQIVKFNTSFAYISGRRDMGGVYFGDKNTYLQKYDQPNTDGFSRTAAAIKDFSQRVDLPIYLALVPGSTDIWKDRLPNQATAANQKALIDEINRQAGDVTCIDVYSAMQNHQSEDIYYRTDWHWTSIGAYYGYQACMNAMGIDAIDISRYSPFTLSNNFYGSNYAKAPLLWTQPDRIDAYVDNVDVRVTGFDGKTYTENDLYVERNLGGRDQYTVFLGGNKPLAIVRTGNETLPNLLVLRDSFMDTLTPFLTPHFNEIHLIDARYFKFNVEEYSRINKIDEILIIYSIPQLDGDAALQFALSENSPITGIPVANSATPTQTQTTTTTPLPTGTSTRTPMATLTPRFTTDPRLAMTFTAAASTKTMASLQGIQATPSASMTFDPFALMTGTAIAAEANESNNAEASVELQKSTDTPQPVINTPTITIPTVTATAIPSPTMVPVSPIVGTGNTEVKMIFANTNEIKVFASPDVNVQIFLSSEPGLNVYTGCPDGVHIYYGGSNPISLQRNNESGVQIQSSMNDAVGMFQTCK